MIAWWQSQRTSARLAFILQLASRFGNALLNLLWTRLLLDSMGRPLFGLFATFQSVAALGGLGELGFGALVSVQVGQHLGRGTATALQSFLASIRGVFLVLAMLLLVGTFALSPWLPRWFGFEALPNSGSLTLLFCLGALNAALLIVNSYISNINHAVGNVTWPVIPAFVLTQAAVAAHCVFAWTGAPLTVQYTPYIISTAVSVAVVWWFVKISHRELAGVFPLQWRLKEWVALLAQSFWSYLWSVGFLIFTATARILINKGFGADPVAAYTLNSKLCELAFFIVATAGFVAIPKLATWLASNEPADRARAATQTQRLNSVQAFLGCVAGTLYIVGNDWFITVWVGKENRFPIEWQWALAENLAIVASGAAAVQLSSRCGPNGLRFSGAMVGIAGLINFVLSLIAMKLGSIFGILAATVIAQSFFNIVIGRFVCRYIGRPFVPWFWRNWVFPVLAVSIAYGVRVLFPSTTGGVAAGAFAIIVLLFAIAWIMGITPTFIRAELRALTELVKSK